MRAFLIVHFFFIFILMNTASCQISKKMERVKTRAGEIGEVTGQRFAKGMMNGFLQDSAQQVLNEKLDSVMNTIDEHLKHTSQGLRDTMLGQYTALWMQKRLLDIETTMADARTELLGSKTKYLMAELRNEMLGDVTVAKLAAMRNELLGSKTNVLLDSVIQNALISFTAGYKNNIKPELASTVSDTLDSANGTIKKLKTFAWALGGITAGLMILGGFIFIRYRKHKELVQVLTKEIDVIPDRTAYDQLVSRIKDQAVGKGLNDRLNEILKEQNLPEKENWKRKNRIKDEKMFLLLGDFLNKCKSLDDPESVKLVNDLRREAIQQNVEKELDRMLTVHRENLMSSTRN